MQTMKVSGRLLRLSGVAVAGALLSAMLGCTLAPGGDSLVQPEGCSSPGVTGDEIKVGLLYPQEGAYAIAFRGFRGGIDARFGVENARGGVGGRKITYEWEDDAGDAARNLVAARSLVERDKVFSILEGTLASAGSSGYLDGDGIPVTGVSVEPSWAQHRNMFAFAHWITNGPSVSTWGEYIRSEGGTRAALLTPPLDPLYQLYARKVSDSLQAAGVNIAFTAEVGALTNYDALAQRMKEAKVDTISGAPDVTTLTNIVPAARKVGLPLKVVLAPTGYDPLVLQAFGQQLAGTSFVIGFIPFELDLPPHHVLLDALAQYAPQIQPPTQASAMVGWLAADMFIRGVQAAGDCLTREKFIHNLRAVSDYNGGGLLPQTVDFVRTATDLSTCYEFVQISADGQRFVPKPGLRCGKLLTTTGH
jgi:branched-chain amino acid transport system substrate-binding protein